jgi:phage/plasmid-associated DNA primase
MVDEDIQMMDITYQKMIVDEITPSTRLSRSEQAKELYPYIADACGAHGYRWLGDERGYFVRLHKGIYRRDVTQLLNRLIRSYFDRSGQSATKNMVNEVMDIIRSQFFIHPNELDNNHQYIILRNGRVAIWGPKAWELQPANQDMKTMIQIPHDYVENAECPKWDKFIRTVANGTDNPEESYLTLWEIMGYCMQFSVKMKKAFFLISKESNTGKSTYLNVLTALVGEENCAKTRLDKLTNQSFGAGAAAHKLLNYFDDLPRYIKVETVDIWKSQIDGKELDYEKKYHDATKHPNILKQIYAANALPKLAWDLTVTVRLLIIRFGHIFKEGIDMVKHWELYEIINNEREMEGIVYKAIKSLRRLFERGYFLGADANSVLHEVKIDTDVIYRFIHRTCKLGVKDENAKRLTEQYYYNRADVLYARFKQFQDMVGDSTQISKNIFTKALKKMGITKKRILKIKNLKDLLFEAEEDVTVYLGAEFVDFPEEYVMDDE